MTYLRAHSETYQPNFGEKKKLPPLQKRPPFVMDQDKWWNGNKKKKSKKRGILDVIKSVV